MSVETYLIYLAVVAVFFATPPDTSQLLIISNSFRHGLRKSGWTILGDLSANCIQMTAAAFGLAAIIATSASGFILIKWFGVVYLLWVGLGLILSKSENTENKASKEGKPLQLFNQGFLTSMVNPYAVIFFGALFPQFIESTLSIFPQLIILGATYLVVDGLILLLWGWLGFRMSGALKSFSLVTVNKLSGCLMVGAATLLGMKEFQPQEN